MRGTAAFLCSLSIGLTLLLSACGGGASLHSGLTDTPAALGLSAAQRPSALPTDGVQPWETLDSNGAVLPENNRGASAVDDQSEFSPGVERFLEGGTVADNGEACTLSSEADTLSYAIYRLPLGGQELGAASVDVNTLSGDGYFVGLSDYGHDAWQWFGPFEDNHLRLSAGLEGKPGASFISALGNTFIAVVAFDSASVDVVGVGADPEDAADTSPPPAPVTPTLTPVQGGLLAEWLPVAAGDLAGYRVYYSSSSFSTNGAEPGVEHTQALEGLTSHLLNTSGNTFIRLSAVDISGNESVLSPVASATPLVGAGGTASVTVSAPSGMLNDALTLTSSGGNTYDFDLDGNGIYDITDTATALQSVDTSATGIIRPHVRTYQGGVMTAQGGVSLIIVANTRPAASATASPQSGSTPLSVTFTGAAEDTEDPVGDLTFAWDFDGDGIFEPGTDTLTPSAPDYLNPGLFNAKLRAEDTDGAWDVDTVTIQATDGNPVAVLAFTPASVSAGQTVRLDGSGSSDYSGSIEKYEWDADGDGSFETDAGPTDFLDTTFIYGGDYLLQLRITDEDGLTAVASRTLHVSGWAAPVSVNADNLDVGQFCSLAEVNGKPAISYCDTNYTALLFSAAADPAGNNWLAPLDLTAGVSALSVGEFSSLAVINDNPAISYHQTGSASTGDDLMFIRANDSAGTDWPAGGGVVADDGNDFQREMSMAIVNGNPAVAYYDLFRKDLRYVRATNASGTSWGIPITIDRTGDVGDFCSLAVVNGMPAASYFDSTASALKFCRAANADGSAWGNPLTIDSDPGEITGRSTSLAIISGNPAISYTTTRFSDLRFIRATDTDGASWGSRVNVQSNSMGLLPTCLRAVNGNPAIIYTNTSLRTTYIRASNGTGTAWAAPVELGPISSSLGSLETVSANPAVSYYNVPDDRIEYRRATDANGTGWSAAVTLASGVSLSPGFHEINLLTVNGNPAVIFGTFLNLQCVRASDDTGTAPWGVPVVVEDSADLSYGFASSLLVNGNPAVASGGGNGDLAFYRANDANGASWAPPLLLDPGSNVGLCTDLGTTGESTPFPMIAYFDSTQGDLCVIRANDLNGTTWPPGPVTADSGEGNNVGFTPSLDLVAGVPAVSYSDLTDDDLRYIRATNTLGSTWGNSVVVDSSGPLPLGFSSLEVINGRPAISYLDIGISIDTLRFIRADDNIGAVWGAPAILDPALEGQSPASLGGYTSLMQCDGRPWISFLTPSPTLGVASAVDANGAAWQATEFPDPGTTQTGAFSSMAVIAGAPAIAYQYFADAGDGDLMYVRFVP